jgi:hypothetical protein
MKQDVLAVSDAFTEALLKRPLIDTGGIAGSHG